MCAVVIHLFNIFVANTDISYSIEMKKILFILVLFIAVAVGTSCDKEKDYIKLVNYSHQDIYVFDAYTRDEILPTSKAELGNLINKYYRSGTYKTYTAYFDIDYNLCDTLYVTVLSADTIAKYTWETIIEKEMIMQRYIIPFNESYLKSINYTIKFRD